MIKKQKINKIGLFFCIVYTFLFREGKHRKTKVYGEKRIVRATVLLVFFFEPKNTYPQEKATNPCLIVFVC
jgi:hypothetical protein